jgi:hypothetical protein
MTSSPSSAHAGAGSSIQLAVQSGHSPLPHVAYQAGVPPTRSTVGSGGDVEWPLSAPGVELRHAEIAWDGQQVWVRDLGSQRGTFVDAMRIGGDWVAVSPGSQIRLGQAVIAASAVGGATAMVAHAGRARSADFDDDQPTQLVPDEVVPQAPIARPLPRAGGPAALPKAPSTGAFAADGGGESTVIVQSPFDESGRPAAGGVKAGFASTDPRGAPAGAVPPPRIGKITGQGSIPAPAVQSAVDPANSEATVAFSVPDELPPAPMLNRPGAQPLAPAGAPPTFGAPASNPFGQIPPSPEAAGFNGFNGQGGVANVFGSIPPPPPVDPNANKKPLFTLPKRTLVMLGGTLAAALGLLLFGGGQPPPGPAHPTTSGPELPATPLVQYTPPIAGAPADPTGTLLAASTGVQPPPPPDAHARRTPDPVPPPIDTVPERVAANTLAQGRLRDAISLYDQLALAHPETPVFAHVAVILRRKIEAQGQQCPPGSPPTCVPTPPIPTPPAIAAMVGAAPRVPALALPNAVPAPQSGVPGAPMIAPGAPVQPAAPIAPVQPTAAPGRT